MYIYKIYMYMYIYKILLSIKLYNNKYLYMMRPVQMFKVEVKGINEALYISTLQFLYSTDLFFAVMQANNRGLWLYLLSYHFLCHVFCNHVEIRLTIVTGSMLHGQRGCSRFSWLARNATTIIARWFVIIASVAFIVEGQLFHLPQEGTGFMLDADSNVVHSRSRWKRKFLTDLLTELISNLGS